jgi:hypothetical protein
MAWRHLPPHHLAAISAPEPVKVRATGGVLNMAKATAAMLVLSVVVWMARLGAEPPSLFHATAASPSNQARAPGGSPYLRVYGEKLAIGSVYWIAQVGKTGGAARLNAAGVE